MGKYNQATCIFTGIDTTPIIDEKDIIEYNVTVNEKKYFIRLDRNAINWKKEEVIFAENEDIFYGLLYNHDWFEDESIIITIDELISLLLRKAIPKTPDEKYESLFLKLHSRQNEDGQKIKFDNFYYDHLFWKILYFKSLSELNYYAEALNSNGLIEASFSPTIDRRGLLDWYRITYDGLNYFLSLINKSENSNKCFVAMSFKTETKDIRTAIKKALDETGFEAILIDELNVPSDKTINDEIIANLKRAKFCIADYTYHSNGVYFESGFALGQGKKVIYTCRKDQFKKAHFDIRPLQHIIYDSPDKLKIDLVHKIDAWIK